MKKKNRIRGRFDLSSWICAVLLFVISFPKWFWGMSQDVITFASLLLMLFAYKDILDNKRNWNYGLILLFIQIIFLGRYFIYSNTNITGYLMVLIRGIGYATIFLCSKVFWQKTVDCFIKLLAFLLIPAIIEHIMIAFLDMQFTAPYYIEECPINPEREYDAYLFNVYLIQTLDLTSGLRFMAFFDEPGVLGNIVMVLLYIQKFNLRKWYNIVLLISGILSFSLTFYFAVAAYYVLFGGPKLKISFLVIFALAIIFFYNNDDIYNLVFRRVEFEDGEMVGYNREYHTDINTWLKRIHFTDYLFWGYQPRERIPYAASWKWAFVLYGIIPSIAYIFTLIISRLKFLRKKSDFLLGVILVVIIWIQRPFIQLYLYAFLLAIPFIYYSESERIRNRKSNDNEYSRQVSIS